MKPMLPVPADFKSLGDHMGCDLIASQVLSSLAKPVTQCGNTDPIHSYNHPQNILHMGESHICHTNSLWLAGT